MAPELKQEDFFENGNDFDSNVSSRNKSKSHKGIRNTLLLITLVPALTIGAYQFGEANARHEIKSNLSNATKDNNILFNELNKNGFISKTGYDFDFSVESQFNTQDESTLSKALETNTTNKDVLSKNGVTANEKYEIDFGKKNLVENLLEKVLKIFNTEFTK